MKFSTETYISFPDRDRFDFPKNIVRVTAGPGGEALLIINRTKTALYDCGMAFCYKGLISNIEKALSDIGRDTLDYVLLSHTHYDHMGALPYIINRWNNVKVCGAEKVKKVFNSQGAKNTIKRLGQAAWENYVSKELIEEVLVDPLRVDIVLNDGDEIVLDDITVRAIETKGHTDCSLAFLLQPEGILIASESTGVLSSPEIIHNAFVKSYAESIDSANKLMKLEYTELIIPHFGIVPRDYAKEHFRRYIDSAQMEKNQIVAWRDNGLSLEEIYKAYEDEHWSDNRSDAQPYEAFVENYRHTIKQILDNY